jgi:hypothetical protein
MFKTRALWDRQILNALLACMQCCTASASNASVSSAAVHACRQAVSKGVRPHRSNTVGGYLQFIQWGVIEFRVSPTAQFIQWGVTELRVSPTDPTLRRWIPSVIGMSIGAG